MTLLPFFPRVCLHVAYVRLWLMQVSLSVFLLSYSFQRKPSEPQKKEGFPTVGVVPLVSSTSPLTVTVDREIYNLVVRFFELSTARPGAYSSS
jgi:hypothetical protein